MHIHIHHHFHSPSSDVLAAINSAREDIGAMMSKLDDSIKALTDAVAQETTVEQSAIALLTGIPGMIKTAVDDAIAAGATDAQLQSLTDLAGTITSNTSDLAKAVTAGTPAAPAP